MALLTTPTLFGVGGVRLCFAGSLAALGLSLTPARVCAQTVTATSAVAATPSQREYQIKAVFLLNFARFVDWPAAAFSSETAPLELAVLGNDPFGAHLDEAVRAETVNHRSIIVKRFKRVEDITSCHVLFISRSEGARLPEILERCHGQGILTVSDSDNFADRGGMIGFVKQKEKVRLQINLDAATVSHLTISAKLLRPSEIVGTWKKRQLRLNDRSMSPWNSEALGGSFDPTYLFAGRAASASYRKI